jgi:hypothetical protein
MTQHQKKCLDRRTRILEALEADGPYPDLVTIHKQLDEDYDYIWRINDRRLREGREAVLRAKKAGRPPKQPPVAEVAEAGITIPATRPFSLPLMLFFFWREGMTITEACGLQEKERVIWTNPGADNREVLITVTAEVRHIGGGLVAVPYDNGIYGNAWFQTDPRNLRRATAEEMARAYAHYDSHPHRARLPAIEAGSPDEPGNGNVQ